MRRKSKRKDEELNFWQPASDMFSALLLIMLLVILLLSLYLVYIPDHWDIDPYIGDDVGGGWTDNDYPSATFYVHDDDDGGGGGGDDDGGRYSPRPTESFTPSPSPTPTVTPTPDDPGSGGGSGGGTGGGGGSGEGPGESTDDGIKVAVYVMLVDAETDRTIKEPDVEFELYGDTGTLQILNTYYPERITFRSYVTTEAGTFYFPEKLRQGAYELHEMTEAEGYDAAPNQLFVLDQEYDWPDPYVVRVPVYPSRNVIRLKMVDAESGLAVTGGSFDVIAAENIITADGTLRYRTGQVVSEIVCDETGYGESDELYLGLYTVRQREIPPYYAGLLEDLDVEVVKKTKVEPALNTVVCDRTRMTVSLADELYPTRMIEGAVFVLRADNGRTMPVELRTDAHGVILLDELDKSTTYRLVQTEAAKDFRLNTGEYAFTVSADGRIDGETASAIEITNRMIRVLIGITDEFSNVQIPNVNLTLYNSADEMIRTWTSSGSPLQLTGLEPGSYYLLKEGDTERHYAVVVHDEAQMQTINIHTTYVLQYLMIGGGAVVTLAIVLLLVRASKKRKQRQAELHEGR